MVAGGIVADSLGHVSTETSEHGEGKHIIELMSAATGLLITGIVQWIYFGESRLFIIAIKAMFAIAGIRVSVIITEG